MQNFDENNNKDIYAPGWRGQEDVSWSKLIHLRSCPCHSRGSQPRAWAPAPGWPCHEPSWQPHGLQVGVCKEKRIHMRRTIFRLNLGPLCKCDSPSGHRSSGQRTGSLHMLSNLWWTRIYNPSLWSTLNVYWIYKKTPIAFKHRNL